MPKWQLSSWNVKISLYAMMISAAFFTKCRHSELTPHTLNSSYGIKSDDTLLIKFWR